MLKVLEFAKSSDKYLIYQDPNKNIFIETIPNRDYINEIGSIKWWKEYLDKELETFDINKKYLPGSLLLKVSLP
jgi:hypothetical protein